MGGPDNSAAEEEARRLEEERRKLEAENKAIVSNRRSRARGRDLLAYSGSNGATLG
jgi:hypothetical protein